MYLTFLCPQDKIIQDGTENPHVSRNEYHKRSPLSTTRNPTEYHRDPKIMCCVLLTSNAIKFRYNVYSDWLKSMLYESIKQGAICESHHVMVFKTKVSHFRYKNTPFKDTNGKGKFKRILIFLFVDKESFWLQNRPLSSSTMFPSKRSTKCPV